MYNRYPLQQSVLYKIRSQKKLANVLLLPDNYFKKHHEYHYEEFSKIEGEKERHFASPDKELKQIQKRIARLLQKIETPEWLHSGVKRKSYITNCREHVEADYVINMDIMSFYDSVKGKYVFKLFRDKFLMPPDVARKITELLLFQEKMPTGGSASQIVTYWAYSEMFENIFLIAQKYSCKFSLYVDDMTFSSDKPIDFKLKSEVRSELEKYNLLAKREKDKYYRKRDPKSVTGNIINTKHQMVLINNMRLKAIKQFEKCRNTNSPKDIEKLLGIYRAVTQVEPDIFPSIKNYLRSNSIIIKEMARERTRSRKSKNKVGH